MKGLEEQTGISLEWTNYVLDLCAPKGARKEREFLPPPPKKKKFFRGWGGTLITLALCVCIIVGGRMAHTVRVVGHSMSPTYEDGAILVTKLNDTSVKDDIARDDIIVCTLEKRDMTVQRNNNRLIKRVVGVPGDTLQIIDGRLYRNKKVVNDNFPFIENAGVLETELKLGENEFFAMGDNRNDSYDCRVFGPITEDEITNIVCFKVF